MVITVASASTGSSSDKKKRKKMIRKALLSFAKTKLQNSQQKLCRSIKNRSSDDTKNDVGQQNESSFSLISPTPQNAISRVLLKLKLSSNSLLIDLGCGDGRWIIHAAQEYGCHCIGCDVDDQRLDLAKRKIDEMVTINSSLSNKICFVKRNVFEYIQEQNSPVWNVNVLIVYLFREAMERIATILKDHAIMTQHHCRFGKEEDNDDDECVQIVCVGFALPSFTPFWQNQFGGIRIYLYRVKRFIK